MAPRPVLKYRVGRVLLAVLAALLAGAGTDAAAQSQDEGRWIESANNYLRPGDMIRITFWREPELNGEFVVDEQGVAGLPLIGPRTVTEMPLEELKDHLVGEIARELRNHEPSIMLLKRVRVLGEVGNPGLYHVDPTMNLGDVIALAAGLTNDAKADQIRLVRDGNELVSDLDATAPVADRLSSGDQIMVPKKSWFARNATWVVGVGLSVTSLVVTTTLRR